MSDCPVRQKSAHGQPKPSSHFLRCCHSCGADFGALAPGNTGERGIWDDGPGFVWYCSVECAPAGLRKELEQA